MTRFARRFWRDETGGTAIEYGLIAALMFLVALTAIQLLGTNVGAMYQKVQTAITTAAP